MEKGGQITIFIIIAVLVVAFVAIFFIFRGSLQSDELNNPEVVSIKGFVESCITEIGKDALLVIGERGGYYFVPEVSSFGIPYYLYNGEKFLPGKEKIENELSRYLDERLILCIGNFSNFPALQIRQSEVETSTLVLDESVVFNVKYPLAISQGESVSRIRDFEIEIPVRLGIIYEASEFVVNKQLENQGDICVSCISELHQNYGLQISIEDNEERTLIYKVVDYESTIEVSPENLIGEVPYEFRFAVKI